MLPERLRASCDTCEGACCSNISLALTRDDAERFRSAGSVIVEMFEPLSNPEDEHHTSWAHEGKIRRKRVKEFTDDKTGRVMWSNTLSGLQEDEGVYWIQGQCGFLDENSMCTVYETRPRGCQQFPVGGWSCSALWKRVQENRAQDMGDERQYVPIELSQKPTG